jgi:hypothetical protein
MPLSTPQTSQLQQQVTNKDIEYVTPPVGEFGVLDWHKLQILSELGYSIAKTHVDGWFEDWTSRKVSAGRKKGTPNLFFSHFE